MDIKVLRYFLALAREQSVTAAAEYLHLTQPTLSRQLAELEAELGTTLFIRGSRRITLTDDGMRLRKRAEDILDLMHKTEQEFQQQAEDISGDIYIGCAETHAMELIFEVFKNLRDEYPNIRLHITSANADDVTDKLDKGLLDFGVLIFPPQMSQYESVLLPAQDQWGVLMRADSPLASLDAITRQDLLPLPLLAPRQRNSGRDISQWLQQDLNSLNIVATYNLIFNAALMVQKGLGYAFCLDKLVNIVESNQLCFKPLEPTWQTDIYFVYKRYQVFSKAADIFLARIKTAFQNG